MRTKFHYCFIGLAFLAGVHSAFAQVINLGIAQDGQQSVLYWPNSPTNYVLQTVTNLSSTNWVTARDTVTVYAAGRGGDAGAPSWLMLARRMVAKGSARTMALDFQRHQAEAQHHENQQGGLYRSKQGR